MSKKNKNNKKQITAKELLPNQEDRDEIFKDILEEIENGNIEVKNKKLLEKIKKLSSKQKLSFNKFHCIYQLDIQILSNA